MEPWGGHQETWVLVPPLPGTHLVTWTSHFPFLDLSYPICDGGGVSLPLSTLPALGLSRSQLNTSVLYQSTLAAPGGGV